MFFAGVNKEFTVPIGEALRNFIGSYIMFGSEFFVNFLRYYYRYKYTPLTIFYKIINIYIL